MQDAAGMPLDQTINDRVGGDLHVSTHAREELKGNDVIDVSRLPPLQTYFTSVVF